MAVELIKSAVDFLNRLGDSGPAVTDGIHKAVAATTKVAQSAHQMAQQTTAAVKAVEFAVKEEVSTYPVVIDNLNATLLRLEWALSVVYWVTIGLMLLCVFHCAFSVWVSLMHIYAAKKVDIVDGAVPTTFHESGADEPSSNEIGESIDTDLGILDNPNAI